MKWGVRKDRQNSSYSDAQRKRDFDVYGRGGVRRINRAMNNGSSISGARSKEAARINSARRKAQVAGQVGSTVGQVGGAVAGLVLSKYAKQKINDESMQMAVTPIISYGASTVAKQLGRYGAQDAVMMLYGYSPSKYRSAGSTMAKSSFDPSNFKFKRVALLRPDGGVDTVDVPVDKKGYADAFAKSMAKNKDDYDYWNNYMMRRLKYYDG